MGKLTTVPAKLNDTELMVLYTKQKSANVFPDRMTVEQAFIIGKTGLEMGLEPMQAIREIYVVQGRAFPKATLVLQLARERVPGFKHGVMNLNDKECRIVMTAASALTPMDYTFTMEQADRSKFSMEYDKDKKQWRKKDQWVKQPETMLFNRCVTFMIEKLCPEYKGKVHFDIVIDEEEAQAAQYAEIVGVEDIPLPVVGQPLSPAEIIRNEMRKSIEDMILEMVKGDMEEGARFLSSQTNGKIKIFADLNTAPIEWLSRLIEKLEELKAA